MKNQCSKLDINHPLSKFFTRGIISSLYGSLLHPPVSYLGQFDPKKTAESTDCTKKTGPTDNTKTAESLDNVKTDKPTDNIRLFQYRNADGSDNVKSF